MYGSSVHSSYARGNLRSGISGRGINLRIGNPYYGQRGSYGRRSYYPYAGYYPYGYYGWYADPLYDSDDQDSYASEYSAAPSDDSGPQGDLDQFNDRQNGNLDHPQKNVEARNRPKLEQQPETALVFRDQHVEEVRNYAISGGMLWVLNDQTAKKIPLAQLDLDATVKMNDDRGVDFQVPGPSLSIQLVN